VEKQRYLQKQLSMKASQSKLKNQMFSQIKRLLQLREVLKMEKKNVVSNQVQLL
jgi:hypothetical protein